MSDAEFRALPATGARGCCDACGHVAYDRHPLGVPIGPRCNLILAACGECRESYARTGRLPWGLAHCSAAQTDEDVTDDLIRRGYCDEQGNWR